MSADPIQTCVTCVRTRSCLKHTRAEFPPDAAKNWLRQTCPRGHDGCRFQYRAGFDVLAKEADREQ